MKQTAVEWLIEELGEYFPIGIGGIELMVFKAKEMEKQQIIDACNQIEIDAIDGMGIHETITKGEQYYKETFNK